MSGNLYLVWVTFPVQIIIGTYLLYQILGWSGVIGVLLMIALLPFNILLSKRLAAVQGRVLAASDARIQSNNEVINAIRMIKYYAWEAPFRKRVMAKRRAEMKIMRSRFIWWSISMTVFHSIPFIITILTCFFYTVVWNNSLGTSVAFPALATFSVLRIPIDRMADSINYIIQAHVSLVRIQKFLQEQETTRTRQSISSNPPSVGFVHASLTWALEKYKSESQDEEHTPFQLQDIDIQFRQGALNIICGPSGSGKSSLLLALLGEMQLEKGRVFLPHDSSWSKTFTSVGSTGTVEFQDTAAYCPHEPWITNQSIRANILLELPFNGPRYEQVLRAVALVQDLDELRDGGQTLAGENGNRLSGGQKQRVSLARALYSPSRYVLLDDCLSALDSHTAKEIFFQAIKGPLMEGRTCVLATHHTRLVVPHGDYVVRMEDGKVTHQGVPTDMALINILGAHVFKQKHDADDKKPDSEAAGVPPGHDHHGQQKDDRPDERSESDEGKEKGVVSWTIVKGYLQDMGRTWFWILVLTGFTAQQLASLGTSLWIKTWAAQYDEYGNQEPPQRNISTNTAAPEVEAWYYLTVYIIICVVYALITFLRDLVTFSGSLKASTKIFERLLDRVLFAKFAFFERPLGQITNRFAKDTNVVDQSLAPFSVSAVQIAGTLTMVIFLVIWVVPRAVLILVLGVVCLAYYYVTALYLHGAQDLKRIELVSRSPLYQQVGETISGYISIRAYGREAVFKAKLGRLVDGLNQPYMLLWASQQWLTVRVSALSSMITLATGAFVVYGVGSIEAGAAGLVLTYAATFTENMMWLIQVYAIIQQSLTSVERIVEYTSVEQETTRPTTANGAQSIPVPEDWPTQASVEFHNFTAGYAPHLDPVLKSINFRARAGERVGVVGRTGAGKSSIALALLRALGADGDGRIEIDGVDIAAVDLARLRGTAVTVIPQDPQLLAGSIRANLDPLGEHDDFEIREVLRSMRAGRDLGPLDPDGGGSDADFLDDLDRPAGALSRGQCQLLCVTRGLLRKTCVLVLDEATANMDHAAEKAVHAGLKARAAEAGTTVITIAHRLLAIADYDRVLVLDAGRVVEQGSIKELLCRRGDDAVFRALCEESGDMEAIRKIAGM